MIVTRDVQDVPKTIARSLSFRYSCRCWRVRRFGARNREQDLEDDGCWLSLAESPAALGVVHSRFFIARVEL